MAAEACCTRLRRALLQAPWPHLVRPILRPQGLDGFVAWLARRLQQVKRLQLMLPRFQLAEIAEEPDLALPPLVTLGLAAGGRVERLRLDLGNSLAAVGGWLAQLRSLTCASIHGTAFALRPGFSSAPPSPSPIWSCILTKCGHRTMTITTPPSWLS